MAMPRALKPVYRTPPPASGDHFFASKGKILHGTAVFETCLKPVLWRLFKLGPAQFLQNAVS